MLSQILSLFTRLYFFSSDMPPKQTAEEIEARDAARLNQLGYKQVSLLCVAVLISLSKICGGVDLDPIL